MAEEGVRYPSVFVVDQEALPPLPPKPGHMQSQQRRNRWIQSTLFLLVCISLGCMLVEAFFIYKLYNMSSESHPNTPQIEAQKGAPAKKNEEPKKQSTSLVTKPLKPAAHLTASKMPDKHGVMQWRENPEVIHDLEYKEGKLVVQKEGYYYIYSKVSFSTDNNFIHSVKEATPRYVGDAIELLRDRRYQQNPALKGSLRSSYLGGIFHLNKKDAIFVHVNDISLVRLQSSDDNFFGMFML